MSQQGIIFDGYFIGLPGAYYGDNVNAAGFIPPPVTPPLLFIGYGWGPQPGVPVTFTNPQNLLNALRGGPASAFVQFLTLPSPALNGAQQITFIDASSNTQSQVALLNSGATNYAVLTSTLYGPPSNLLQVGVSAGSVAGSNFTLIDNYANTEVVGVNLSAPFQVTYTGAATGGVNYTAATGSFAISSPVAGESVTFNTTPGAYGTVSQLVAAINGTGIAYADIISSTNGTLPCSYLHPTGAVLYVSGTASAVNIKSFYEPIYWINNFASSYATAVTGAGYNNSIQTFASNVGPTYFSGATGGPPVLSGYGNALTSGLATPAWAVFCDSNIAGVAGLLAQHCETASSPPYGMWRRGFTGSSVGDSVATTETNAQGLDSLQMCYAYPGIYRAPYTGGVPQLYGGLYAAAAAAGIATGNQIALPLTNKALNGTGVESPGGVALTSTQLSALQNAGVMPIWAPPQSNSVPTILADITTWQVDGNVENTSSQQVACRYWLAYSVVNAVQPFVGSIAAPTTESDITTALIALLNSLVYTGNGSNGVLASWQKGSIVLTYTGNNQLASVTFNATLVGQNRYITCYATLQPLNFTITAATAT